MKNPKLIGDAKPNLESVQAMLASPCNYPTTRWAAYQDHDLGHSGCGHLRFLAVGPDNTFKTAPEVLPDTAQGINWRYVHVGYVNLETGKIDED